MRVRDIMSTDLETIGTGAAAESAWEAMSRAGIHHLVVEDGGAVVGILSNGDLGGRRGAGARAGRTVAELMTRDPVMVSPDTTLRQVANRMRGRSIGCLLVEDGGKVCGIVTVSDLLELLGRGRTKIVEARALKKPRGPAEGFGYPRGTRGRARGTGA